MPLETLLLLHQIRLAQLFWVLLLTTLSQAEAVQVVAIMVVVEVLADYKLVQLFCSQPIHTLLLLVLAVPVLLVQHCVVLMDQTLHLVQYLMLLLVAVVADAKVEQLQDILVVLVVAVHILVVLVAQEHLDRVTLVALERQAVDVAVAVVVLVQKELKLLIHNQATVEMVFLQQFLVQLRITLVAVVAVMQTTHLVLVVLVEVVVVGILPILHLLALQTLAVVVAVGQPMLVTLLVLEAQAL
jgi:hypothetical protein